MLPFIFYSTQTRYLIFYIFAVNKHKTFCYSTPVWFRHQKKLNKCSHLGVVQDGYTSRLFLKSQNCWNSASLMLHQLLIDILPLPCLISPCSKLQISQKHISAINDSASRKKYRKLFICSEPGVRYADMLFFWQHLNLTSPFQELCSPVTLPVYMQRDKKPDHTLNFSANHC